ncbi:hypothetical protein [Gryllotalpicola sp.]|uniref:hypothetical protein n=1 Tax=Gryllotalpicola sp. TaxID=1932787 RepID=UPI002635B848|nr:hypothetical protein [Gryllotalpicola sp.]
MTDISIGHGGLGFDSLEFHDTLVGLDTLRAETEALAERLGHLAADAEIAGSASAHRLRVAQFAAYQLADAVRDLRARASEAALHYGDVEYDIAQEFDDLGHDPGRFIVTGIIERTLLADPRVLVLAEVVGGITALIEQAVDIEVALIEQGWIAAPTGAGDLQGRIPPGGRGAPQFRIEEYDVDGEKHWVIYVAGTADPGFGSEPEDMAANLALYAGLDAKSLQGLRKAMTAAGVKPGDKVGLVGYSQGALIIHRLIDEGRYQVPFALTVGDPQLDWLPPNGTTSLRFFHGGDPVAGLSKKVAQNGDTVTVTSSSYGSGGDLVAPHALNGYAADASAFDASTGVESTAFRATVTAFTGGVAASATTWRAAEGPRPTPISEHRQRASSTSPTGR